jgi:predicted kinase
MVFPAAVLIILGSPASGKTTLAARLATELAIPCYSKDAVKEALFAALGVGDREWSRRLSAASFAAVLELARAQVRGGGPCIVEGNFRPEHAPALCETGARCAQIRLFVDAKEARRRFRERRRHPGHLDAVLEQTEALFPVSGDPFLDISGPRWDYGSDANAQDADARYEWLVGELRSWLMS